MRGVLPAQLLAILLLSAFIRSVAIYLTGSNIVSTDIGNWIAVVDALNRGENPYETTPYLNWPPLWPALLWAMSRFSTTFSLELAVVIKSVLVAFELALTAVVWHLCRVSVGSQESTTLTLFGLVLNPIPIILNCVHGNFDVIVGLTCSLFTLIHVHPRSRNSSAWRMVAAGFLGLGILAKSIPVILLPLLVGRSQQSRSEIGAVLGLALLPAAISIAFLSWLDPAGINEKVINYRSLPGWYGISGLLQMIGLTVFSRKVYPAVFMVATLTVMGTVAKRVRQDPLSNREFMVLTLLSLLFIPTFGPGFGLQYIFWSLPFVVVALSLGDHVLNRAVVTFLAVASITYAGLYSFADTLGAFARVFLQKHLPDLHHLAITPAQSTTITLPMFLAAVGVLASCIRSLRQERALSNNTAN